MKNPNGPSIEERDQMQEHLRERGEDYEAGWNNALRQLEKTIKAIDDDWKKSGADEKHYAAEYIITKIWNAYRPWKCGNCGRDVIERNGITSCGCNPHDA